MPNYAIIESGTVTNIVVWDGNRETWQPPTGAAAIELTEDQFVNIGYSYADGVFAAPPAPPAPPPTAEQVRDERDALLKLAALRIAPLQDAVDLDDATGAETLLLKAWKQYRVALNRIELQSGFPASVVWPDAPQ